MKCGFTFELILRGLVLVTLAAQAASAQPTRAPGAGQDPVSRDDPEKRTPSATAPPPGQPERKSSSVSLENLRLPAQAVLVLYDEAKDALKLLPRLIVMTPEEYQRLQEQIEQLRGQIRADKPEAPSVCKLKGRVEGDLVRLDALFEFHTNRPRATVRLGCRKPGPGGESRQETPG